MEPYIYSVLAALVFVTALMALFAVARVGLMSPDALKRDGLRVGDRGPAWILPTLDEKNTYQSPSIYGRPQLLLFADHSMKSFPSLTDGLRRIQSDAVNLEVEIIAVIRDGDPLAAPVFRVLGLDIPQVQGSASLYAKYNVRVVPFVVLLDGSGRARSSSLVNHDWQLDILLKIAQLPSLADSTGKGAEEYAEPRPVL